MNCSCRGELHPTSISFYWMHDNFTFTVLKGKNIPEILEHADQIRVDTKYGMLCPAILLRGEREIRRIGDSVQDNKDYNEKLVQWIRAIEYDDFAPLLIAKGCINE